MAYAVRSSRISRERTATTSLRIRLRWCGPDQRDVLMLQLWVVLMSDLLLLTRPGPDACLEVFQVSVLTREMW